MPDELAENLSGKEVMTSNGTYIGVLHNIEMNVKTGTISDLFVSPYDDVDTDKHRFETAEDDGERKFNIPVSRVRSVDDCIVVEQ
ncbi:MULTISPECIES: PRC-barrel domain-containing protein [Halobellus]|jgi:sporulation protein YlmC with PRC-barrel domain|uniref:PRC-barrel domain-containing protein n=1 Tax=Halobellus TaxID=1073986 RepID=UPI002880B325|nr:MULTISPECIES: PRC-barrel domain-containing protein [unclassified Halobellus]